MKTRASATASTGRPMMVNTGTLTPRNVTVGVVNPLAPLRALNLANAITVSMYVISEAMPYEPAISSTSFVSTNRDATIDETTMDM